jgi:phosphatidylinositol-3-phosphatase
MLPVRRTLAFVAVVLVFVALFSDRLLAWPPLYDHVVIVVEENRTVEQIIGDLVNAPYINYLATNGVRMGSMFAIEHPSQPNYIQLFSGSNQGVLDDNLPPNFSTTPTGTYPFTAPNLGAELIGAGFTFAGYSEQLEAAGTNDWADYDPHSATDPNVYYRRKHNPWANWIAKVSPVPVNQLTSAVNRAFTQFPSNYSQLPTLSFVIPNQLHDMHDGSRKQGDDWLATNLNAYATWAKTNNSLLIITWDEDDYNQDNQIPTVFYGAGLRNGTVVGGTWTLHHLLRTLEDMYGTTHAGSATQVRSIVGPFASDPAVTMATFRQGLNGYTNAQDTQIWQETPNTNYAASQDLTADLDTSSSVGGNQVAQVLLRYDNLFGAGTNQIPSNAIIHSAKLLLQTPFNVTGTDFDSDDTFRAHRMIVNWNDTATWNSMSGGVSANDVEAATAASFSAVPDVDGGPTIFDVTADVEMFKAGVTNRGWVIRPSSSGTGDGWTFRASENTNSALRPALEIVYSLPTPYTIWAASRGLGSTNNSPYLDPDRDGANNLTEFSYNMNPLLADAYPVTPTGTNGLPAAKYLAGVGNGTLEVQFLRRKGTDAAGLTYTPEFSGNLSTWSAGQAPVITSINADWERVTVRDSAAGPNARRFARVLLRLQL